MYKTKRLAYTGIMTAIVFIATWTIRIPVPATNGYIHPGDGMVFLAAIVLGWKYGLFAAGMGSMLADIIGGYPHWAVPTLIIKSVMALFVGLAFKLRSKTSKAVFAISTAVTWILFISVTKRLLHMEVVKGGEALLGEVEGVSTTTELEGLNRIVQTELTLAAIVIVAVVIGVGLYAYRKDKSMDISILLGMIASGLWMVIGYYCASCIMYGSHAAPLLSIPSNLVQFAAGLVLAMAVYLPLKKQFAHLWNQ